jgi:pimeloyl-ACP methyl ester carboxylesterase
VPAAFGRHVAKWLPDAQQITLDRCGHVPQVERPGETNDLLVSFFAQAERSGLVPSIRPPADAQAA